MEKRELGRSGMEVSAFSLGTWVFGGSGWGGADDAASIETIETAYHEYHINFFDTAAAYGGGRAESLLGKTLRKVRDRVVIATKAVDFSRPIEQSLDKSLKDLDCDYTDLYYIHWPSPQMPIRQMMDEMNALKAKGKIKAIGVSNFNPVQVAEALSAGPVDVLQPPYSLFWRFAEKDLVPLCRRENIGVVTYSPLARGILSGKFAPGWQFKPGDDRPKNVLFRPEHFPAVLQGVEKVRELAREKETAIAAMALKWVVCQPGITSCTIGARNRGQLRENLKALKVNLTEGDFQRLDRISREVSDPIEEKGYKNMFNMDSYQGV